jgi:putative ABC transport system ATP-binding protein
MELPTATKKAETVTPAPDGTAVAVSDITRRFGEGDTAVDALRGVTLDVAGGELVSIMGPSGSGKSTLMHIMAGLDQPTEGEVSIAGIPISKLNDTELTKLRRKNVGFVFQFFNLLPMLTAEENITLPLQLAGGKIDRAWVADVIERVGLTDRKTHRPAELSGGQQQRVAIARALISKPTVLFADEPTGNLDSKSGHEILEIMREAATQYGQTTVMVTHDAGAACIADRTLFLADGLIVKEMRASSAHDLLGALEEIAG